MKRIMIVDDSLYARLILRDLLLSLGYSVVAEANSGRDALDMFKKVMPDAVIVDAAMPDMDGIATTKELKREHPDAIVILSAGRGERSAIVEGFTAGASDFLAKPYTSRHLHRTLRKTIG